MLNREDIRKVLDTYSKVDVKKVLELYSKVDVKKVLEAYSKVFNRIKDSGKDFGDISMKEVQDLILGELNKEKNKK